MSMIIADKDFVSSIQHLDLNLQKTMCHLFQGHYHKDYYESINDFWKETYEEWNNSGWQYYIKDNDDFSQLESTYSQTTNFYENQEAIYDILEQYRTMNYMEAATIVEIDKALASFE